VTSVSVVIASYNVWPYLERCLQVVSKGPHEVIVVDSASTDGSAAHTRERFPGVRVIELEPNPGYGGAINAGITAARGDYLFADSQPQAGIVGPRLVNPDGTLQPSLRGFPSRWRLATEYLFLRWLAPRSRFLNAFYGAGFDYSSPRQAEFLMGAALLLRRAAVDAVGTFDTSFFMFSEEVDLCYRMHQAGWAVEFYPGATFVHVGGASTRHDWASMYREQLRGHLRFLAKHHGIREAERTRRMLVWAFRARALVFRGARGRLTRETARWLASGDVTALLERQT
jgi:N-acetylglucosaminyl-diphospho-decaprenol L-rhamnosyltransferase